MSAGSVAELADVSMAALAFERCEIDISDGFDSDIFLTEINRAGVMACLTGRTLADFL
jgi:hypothetical protein